MKIIIAVLVGVLLAGLLVGLVNAGDKCTGAVYKDHPGLVAECLHNQTVNHDPYPGADDTPYPLPGETPFPFPGETPFPVPGDEDSSPYEAPMLPPGFITPTSPAHDIGDHCYPFIPGGCN